MPRPSDCTLATETKWGLGLVGAGLVGGAFAFPKMSGLFMKAIAVVLLGIVIWYIWCKAAGIFCAIPVIGDLFCASSRNGMRASKRPCGPWGAVKNVPKAPLRMWDATV